MSLTKRIERAEAVNIEGEQHTDPLSEALQRVRAGHAPAPLRPRAECELLARKRGLAGRIGRASLQAGLYRERTAELEKAAREAADVRELV